MPRNVVVSWYLSDSESRRGSTNPGSRPSARFHSRGTSPPLSREGEAKLRLQVEDQEQDARLIDNDGETVVILRAGLLSPRAEAVVGRVLHLLDHPSQVVAYPRDVLLRD